MAGDWIKMRTDLYRHPKVSVIADCLMDMDGALAAFVDQNMQRDMTVTRNVMRNVTVGALVSVWGVMRQTGKRRDDDLICSGVTAAVLDDIADLPGFGAAMATAGWVIETPEGIEFPRFFEDHNVDPEAKALAANADRQRRFRERQKAKRDAEITPTSDVTSDVTVTHREEKSREEKREPARARKTTIPPGFGISERVSKWASEKGYGNLQPQLEALVSHAKRNGAKYVDWDEALMNAVRSDWAKVNKPANGADIFAGAR
jgi:hypothetical protein